jgi:hypothetical protein
MSVLEQPSPGPTSDLPPGAAQDVAAAALLLARRAADGATLWCASPAWPHHAQHVAVEFVHPVVVGKPALPAVAVPAHDVVAVARANACSGDVLVAIGPAADPALRELAARAPAWGVAVVWIGAGPRPPDGAADHVLWFDEEGLGGAVGMATYDGRFILVYHLLWELAHVCLEHGSPAPPVCEGPVCTTCSDEGRLAEVLRVRGTTARVRTPDGTEDVELALVGGAAAGDLLLVHAGMAITRVVVP